MKVTVKRNAPEPKLVAVTGAGGEGLYVRSRSGGTVYINSDPVSRPEVGVSLEELARNHIRMPVYEGDEVTIKF